MKFNELLRIVGKEPLFSSALLFAGLQSPNAIRVQLSRWVEQNKLIKLRRSLYAVSPEFSGFTPDPFIVANAMVTPSYVSCQTALAWHGVIPEASTSITSITSGRSCTITNSLGTFIYRHIKPELLWGYEEIEMRPLGSSRIALPEKALLDLTYLEPKGDSLSYLNQLRLNPESISDVTLHKFATRWNRKKISRTVDNLDSLLAPEKQ